MNFITNVSNQDDTATSEDLPIESLFAENNDLFGEAAQPQPLFGAVVNEEGLSTPQMNWEAPAEQKPAANKNREEEGAESLDLIDMWGN